ncbi:hypothetical protein HPB50_002507 [Hyalomma asiaticum]|uniref:Uncharacterized protein n=1 Tax=Hyalomma asiaticum TaxID=266040 RepID=A0ACB7SE65_HYAAI|nr:hypothetical protein HPB50_002507 [Hyalomma asiaticum]
MPPVPAPNSGAATPGGKGLIVTHCGSEHGFVESAAEVFQAKKSSGDYHKEMNGDHYEKWFSQKLLPLLPPGVPWSSDMVKAELMKLVDTQAGTDTVWTASLRLLVTSPSLLNPIGVSISGTLTALTVVLAEHFEKRRATAYSIVFTFFLP